MKKMPFSSAIPENRLIEIRAGDSSIIDVPLFFEDDFSIKASSKFGSIWDAEPNNLLSLLASSAGGITDKILPSGQFAMQGSQIWQSTDPLTFSFSASLYMIDSGLNDVVKPAMALVQTCLPTKAEMSNDINIGKVNIKLTTLIPPGPNLQAILNTSGVTNKNTGESFFKNGARGTYTLKIGRFLTIPNVIITSAEPTFSKICDEDGYPISASIDFEITTMEIATTDMITNMVKSM